MTRKYFKKSNKISSGFTLIETLIAISIFSVSLITLMSILGNGLSNIKYTQAKITASYLAQEGIEYTRNIRDNYIFYTSGTGKTWSGFVTLGVAGISFPSPYPNFIRTIEVTPNPLNSDEVQVSSTVSWIQGSGPFSITFTENLFNWSE